jgi:hypothetical protein
MEMASIAVMLITQWAAAAATLWLTWWAAQSRDSQALRVIAIVLVVVPALISPLISIPRPYATPAEQAALISLVFGGISLLRAILLIVWAIVSRDRAYLRIGGGVIAALTILGMIVGFVAYRLSYG